MNKRATQILITGLFAGAWSVVACTAGVSMAPDLGQAYENKQGDFESPGQRREPPPGSGGGTKTPTPGTGGQDVPSGTSGTSGTSGSSGGTTGCPPCDTKATCQASQGGQTATVVFTLETKNGVCVIKEGEATLTCDGKVQIGGKDAGTWTASGANNFTVSASGANYTCVKGAATTPVPTGTTTPTDGGTVPKDSGGGG